jgi:hypothetical protein
VEEDFAANRQKFLAEQGYKYSIQHWTQEELKPLGEDGLVLKAGLSSAAELASAAEHTSKAGRSSKATRSGLKALIGGGEHSA